MSTLDKATLLLDKIFEHQNDNCQHCDALLRETFGLKDKTSEAEATATDRKTGAIFEMNENDYKDNRTR